MRFIIPHSVYDDVVNMQALETGTNVARENKKILRDYFIQMGVKPKKVKGVMRAMGFVHPHLGN